MERFIENKDLNHGLLLINTPTASGKSTAAAEVIFEEYVKEKNLPIELQHHFFYLTTLKTNVYQEYQTLKMIFEKNELGNEFEDKVLVLPSNLDGFLNFVNGSKNNELNLGKNYGFMTDSPSFRELRKKLTSYKSIIELVQKGALSKDDQENFLAKVREAESKFRSFLTDHFSNEFKDIKDTKDRYEKIVNEYPDLLKIYPSIKIFARPIILMTIAKFFYGTDPIIRPPFKFINDDIIKKAVIFIDEIDSCKDSILNHQINEWSNLDIDFPSMFQSMEGAIKTQEFPKTMIGNFNYAIEENKEKRASSTKDKVFENIKKEIEFVYDKCKLKHFLKLSPKLQGKQSLPFLFKDNDVISIGENKDGNRYYIEYEQDEKYNFINKGGKIPEGGLSLSKFVDRLDTNWKSICNLFNIMAYNFETEKISNGYNPNNMDHKSILSSILDTFGLKEKNVINHVNQCINAHPYAPKKKNEEWLECYDFYMQGFSIYSFQDNQNEGFRTKVTTLSLLDTPENFLYRVVDQAKVIGLSATCTIDSPICNFPLSYFKDKLNNSFISVSQEEKERMKDHFQNVVQKKNKASIKIMECDFAINEDERKGNQEELNRKISQVLFENDEKQQDAFINKFLSGCEDGYKKQQLVKLFLALIDFLKNDNLQTLLVFRNESPKDSSEGENAVYSIKNTKDFLEFAEGCMNIKKKFDVLLFTSATAAKFKENKNKNRKENDKLVVLTTYKSAGIGQNLQFSDEPEGEESLGDSKIFNMPGKDFDSIYLEKPTYVLVNLNEKSLSKNQKELNGECLQAIYQYRALYENGEIDKRQLNHCLWLTAQKAHLITEEKRNISKPNNPSVYELPSVNRASWKIIIQAIGRICRTREKSEENQIVIYYDKNIANIDCSFLDGMLLNRETQALVDKIRSSQKTEREKTLDSHSKELTKKCRNTNQMLQSILSINRKGWSIKNMESWRRLRDIVLKNPTMGKEEYSNQDYHLKYLYVEDPSGNDFSKYWFKQNESTENNVHGNNDFFENVTFLAGNENKSLSVSEDDCGLSKVATIDFLREAFEEKGYPITFKKNPHILNPVAYTNIYKGALGEFAGKEILKKMGVFIEEIKQPENFEKFDFLVTNTSIYVDFKNWHGSTFFDEEEEISKIQKKLMHVRGQAAIIINLINPDKNQPYEKGNLLMVPGLLRKNTDKGYVIDLVVIEKIQSYIDRRKGEKNAG